MVWHQTLCAGDAASVYDWSCMNHTGSPCKSGLPFYSMRSNGMTPALCFEFCIGKGLDIFALVEGVECRCGASAVNSHDNGLDISHLQFNPAALTLHLNDMTGCPVRAYRYAGHYEGAGFSNPQDHQGPHPPTTPQAKK